MSELVCSCCGEPLRSFGHPAWKRPAAVVDLTDAERARRVTETDEFCTLDAGTEAARYFVRGRVEVPVYGLSRPWTWALWVEVSESDFRAAVSTPRVSAAPLECQGRIEVELVPGYPDLPGAPCRLQFRAAEPPRIVLIEAGHKLYSEQQEGIFPERVHEIVRGLTLVVH